MTAAIVGGAWHGDDMPRLFAVLATAIVALTVAVTGPAAADPGPTPAPPGPDGGFGSGWARCGDQLVPADPRVDMSNPFGGLIYRRMLEAMCETPPQDPAP